MAHDRPLLGSLGLLLAAVVVLTASGSAAAELYKWVGADGTVTYSDRPQPTTAESAPAPPPSATDAAPAPKPEPAAPPRLPASAGPATADEVLELSGVKPQLAATPAKLA